LDEYKKVYFECEEESVEIPLTPSARPHLNYVLSLSGTPKGREIPKILAKNKI
jgi:hypothetical protein